MVIRSENDPKKAVATSEYQPISVALRVRPIHEDEILQGATIIAHCADDKMVALLDPLEDHEDILRANRSREKHFVFDVALDGKSSQEDVYLKTTKSLIDNVINGFNATVFAYGATGAGKTYTMVGTDSEPGIMVRALNDLFQGMADSESMTYEVTMSYLEIYNEVIRDLLNPSSGYLELREDSTGIHVANISEISASSSEEVLNLLQKGNKQRTCEPTKANKTSSRSHAVLQVNIKQKSRVINIVNEVKLSKLFMIDLAGSERASHTENRGIRLKEGAHINRSLLALGNCINALAEKGAKYVNYRDSKLTRLLKDSLGGNCKTVMIAHISPASNTFEESRNTLIYADRAKNIKNKVKRNVLDVTHHIAQYTTIIDELRKEISRLQNKIEKQKDQRKDSTLQAIQSEVVLVNKDRSLMNQLKEQLISAFKEQMNLRHQLMETKNIFMEMNLEAQRYLQVISDWEFDKKFLKTKSGDNKEFDNSEKEKGEKDAEEEPEEVKSAREELKYLRVEHQKCSEIIDSLKKELELSRNKSCAVEETLSKKVNSEEQREILLLLCKIHTLEVHNIEIQMETLLKDHELKRKDFIMATFDHHRTICHDLIQKQRNLIDDHKIPYPAELEELYCFYQQDWDDQQFFQRNTCLRLPQLEKFRRFLDIESVTESDRQSPVDDDLLSPTYKTRRTARKSFSEESHSTFPRNPLLKHLHDHIPICSPLTADSRHLFNFGHYESKSPSPTELYSPKSQPLIIKDKVILEPSGLLTRKRELLQRRCPKKSQDSYLTHINTIDNILCKNSNSMTSVCDEDSSFPPNKAKTDLPPLFILRNAVSDENLINTAQKKDQIQSKNTRVKPSLTKPWTDQNKTRLKGSSAAPNSRNLQKLVVSKQVQSLLSPATKYGANRYSASKLPAVSSAPSGITTKSNSIDLIDDSNLGISSPRKNGYGALSRKRDSHSSIPM